MARSASFFIWSLLISVCWSFFSAFTNATPELFNSRQFTPGSQFPVGIYDRIDKPEHLTEIKKMGFDLVMPYTNPYARGNFQTIQTYLDRANSLGIRVILEPNRQVIKTQNLPAIIRFVRNFVRHPALYGWYSYDEPVFNQISPRLLEQVYRLIKREDRHRPIILDFSGPRSRKAIRYSSGFDIGMINQYPLKHGVPIETAFKTFRSEVKSFSRLNRNDFWLVLQSFRGDQKWRLPKLKEQKYMLYSGLAKGATGIFFYAYHRAPLAWQQKVVVPLVRELKTYLPAISKGQVPGVKSDRREVETLLYPDNNGYLLVAINHQNKTVASQIELAQEFNFSQVLSAQTKQAFQMTHHMMRDTFAPYEVRFYRVD